MWSRWRGSTVVISELIIKFYYTRKVKEQQRAFAWFYFWVTFGSLCGDLGLPILRQTTGYIIAYLVIAG